MSSRRYAVVEKIGGMVRSKTENGSSVLAAIIKNKPEKDVGKCGGRPLRIRIVGDDVRALYFQTAGIDRDIFNLNISKSENNLGINRFVQYWGKEKICQQTSASAAATYFQRLDSFKEKVAE